MKSQNITEKRTHRIAHQRRSEKLMTNDELERIMNFIIERQEYATEQIAKTTARQEGHEERIARFERSYTVIAELLAKHDTQIVAVTEGHNKLTDRQDEQAEQLKALTKEVKNLSVTVNNLSETVNNLATTVDRYIRARGNGSNGS